MRAELDRLNAQQPELVRAYLTAYAESDYFNDRRQLMQDGRTYTVGLFQQSPKYWSGLTDIAKATREFLTALRTAPLTSLPVRDCWRVQGWNAPSPGKDPAGWSSAAETRNFTDRLYRIPAIMADPLYFTHHPDGAR